MLNSSRKTVGSILTLAIIALVIVLVNVTGNSKPRDVILVTHDSFVMSKSLVDEFDKATGYTLKLLKAGDAGSLVNRLILTKATPIGDAVFGIDNTFSGVAQSNDILDGNLTATDFGDVCFNFDKTWFATKDITPPTSISDLVQAKYKGMAVVENPNTSSTGLSFLAATIDKFGENGWQGYWSSLKSNGVKVDNGWEAAYYTDFSGSSGKGKYPIVLSYASSPADEVRANGQSQTANILDGCFRQTEYVGILKGAKNRDGAAALVKFMLEKKFQSAFPTAMYMYPVVDGTEIPESWKKFTEVSKHPYGANLDFNSNRKKWLATWTAIFS